MHIKRNIGVAFTGLALVVTVLVIIYAYLFNRVDYSTLDYIARYQKGAFRFMDLAGDICVTSVDDIGYVVKGKYDIVIHYGKQVIAMHESCFNDETFRKKCKAIGLVVLTHEDEDTGEVMYKVTCWDQPVTEWSRTY